MQIVGGVLAILSGVILVLFFAKLDEVCFDLHVVLASDLLLLVHLCPGKLDERWPMSHGDLR